MKAAVAIALITGCSNEKETVTEVEPVEPIETVEPEPQEQKEEEVIEQETVFPLTGLSTDASIDHRPFAVTINNHRKARPQSGLMDADIVYEVLAEFELTRLVALYHSKQPEKVGPVRSARGYHIDIANGYDSLFISHGWSPEAKDRLLIQNEADHLNGMEGNNDGALFKRSSERKAPHNSYITYENIVKGLESKGYNLSGETAPLSFYEDNDVDIDGVPASEITIHYNNLYDVTYRYDESQKAYSRYNGSSQSIDYETEEPLRISNVFIVETTHKVIDEQGRRQIDLTSGGNAILLQNGVAVELAWENHDGKILPVKSGEDVKFLPGQTWINIVPTNIEQRVVIDE